MQDRHDRRAFLRLGGLVAASVVLGSRMALAAQRSAYVDQALAEAAKGTLDTLPLPGGMMMVVGPRAGNIAVLPNAKVGTLLVDAGFSTTADQLHALLKAKNADNVKLLVSTHWHLDHTNGNAGLHRAGAKIVAHRNTARWLATGHTIDIPKVITAEFPPTDNAGLPEESFRRTNELQWGEEKVTLTFYPYAHTDGDIAVYFANANVLHTGDLFCNGSYPFIDATTGGSVPGMVAAGRALMKLADPKTVIVPGHGPVAKEPELEAFVEMLEMTGHRVREGKAQGHSLDDMIALRPTRDFDAKWGTGFLNGDRFTANLYAAV